MAKFFLHITFAVVAAVGMVACVKTVPPPQQSLRMIKGDTRVYANKVLNSAQTQLGVPQSVLGAPDFTRAGTLAMGDGYIIVDMGAGEEIIDGPGDDLRIWETDGRYYPHIYVYGYKPGEDVYTVFVSNDLVEWTSLGREMGTGSLDLADAGLRTARYVKIVGESKFTSYTSSGSGPAIDAIEALHMAGTAVTPVAPVAAVAGMTLVTPAKPLVDADAIAVIIGNRNYSTRNKDVPDVDFAHNDFELMRTLVLQQMHYQEGNVIALKDATQADLINVFGTEREYRGQLYDWIKPGVSNVFVYYSGHGAPSLADGKGYLLPVDANPNRVELNGYGLETLYANLAKLNARSVTVVIDACFSGTSQSGTIVKNASSISLRRVVTPAVANDRMVVLTASGGGEVASWDTERKNGLFTRIFVEGVSGEADKAGSGNRDGKVTLAELKEFLAKEVGYFARRNYSREQHPEVHGRPEATFLP